MSGKCQNCRQTDRLKQSHNPLHYRVWGNNYIHMAQVGLCNSTRPFAGGLACATNLVVDVDQDQLQLFRELLHSAAGCLALCVFFPVHCHCHLVPLTVVQQSSRTVVHFGLQQLSHLLQYCHHGGGEGTKVAPTDILCCLQCVQLFKDIPTLSLAEGQQCLQGLGRAVQHQKEICII